ncbi:probable salivary secreted peptide [Drosophila takahashii]|uniref:probable salivary secreted peptide n=1 Tax=Drosophila takahashii TaxID=29030 RepID=UPI0038990190
MAYFVKLIFVAIPLIALVSVVFGSQNGSTTFGVLEKGARLIHKEEIVEEKKFFRIVTRKIVFKPQPHKIGSIVITDNSENNGGKASLLEGGPSANFAVLQFKSARNHGLNFTLEIFDNLVTCNRCLLPG